MAGVEKVKCASLLRRTNHYLDSPGHHYSELLTLLVTSLISASVHVSELSDTDVTWYNTHPHTLTRHMRASWNCQIAISSITSECNIILDLRHFKSPGQCKSIKCYKCDRCWHVSQNQMQLKSHFIPINASRDFNKPSSALRRLISVSGLLSIVNQFNVTRVGIYSPKLQPHPHYCSARQHSVCL